MRLLSVVLNGTEISPGEIFEVEDGQIYVEADLLYRMRFARTTGPAYSAGDRTYYPLAGFTGVSYRIDQLRQALVIEAAAIAFERTEFSTNGEAAEPTAPSGISLILNYDAVALREDSGESYGANAELLLGTAFGVLANSAVTRSGAQDEVIRLESSWTTDIPRKMVSLRLGDSITVGTPWRRPLRYGGVQFTRNFTIRPGFLAMPTLGLEGDAALPSTVELYVDDVLTRRFDAPAGPFAVTDIVAPAGSGQATLVVRDILGREQVIQQDFYAAPTQLRPGVTDFAIEAGSLRNHFGQESSDYDGGFFAASYRRGLTDTWTLGVGGDAAREHLSFGGEASMATPVGVFRLAAAGGEGEDGPGSFGAFTWDFRNRVLGAGIHYEITSPDFPRLGESLLRDARETAVARFSTSLTDSTGFSANLVRQTYHDDGPDQTIGTARLSQRLGKRASLSITGQENFEDGQWSAGLFLSVALGRGITASTFAEGNDTTVRGAVQASKSTGERGIGWRLNQGLGDNRYSQAGVTAATDYGVFSAEAAQYEESEAFRGQANGAVVMAGGGVFLTRPVDGAVGIVRVPDQADVKIYRDNRLTAVTNRGGYALIPGLTPYGPNTIRIDPLDLPVDATIETDEAVIVPYSGTANLMTFDIRRERGMTAILHDRSGRPLPVGAMVRDPASGGEWIVGYDGVVFISGQTLPNRLEIVLPGGMCTFGLPEIAETEALPAIGPISCGERIP